MTKRRSIQGMGELFVFGKEETVSEQKSSSTPDGEERTRALETTRSWIVEAPAGSGKTGLLIQRYLKLLGQPEVEQPEQVLAITFTIKAAGEIRERIVQWLERAANEPVPTAGDFEVTTYQLAAAALKRDQQLTWGILRHPRRLNIRTIDSVCSEITRSLPVLSGSSGLKPVENASTLHRLAAERTMMQLGSQDHRLNEALTLVLLHRDGNLLQCRDLLAEMLAVRDQWGRLIPLDRDNLEDSVLDAEVLPQLEASLSRPICAELARLQHLFPAHMLDELSGLAAEMGYRDGYDGLASPIAVCAGRSNSPKATADALEHWKALAHLLVKKSGGWRSGFNRNHVGFDIDRKQVGRLKEIVSSLQSDATLLAALEDTIALPPAKYPVEQWKVAKALFRILHHALAELQLVFAERGECDFTELGLLARSALNHNSGVVDIAAGAKLQHLLVDEMQDTSTSQYELIQLLTEGWDGRSQTVFLVGDPKQSIYLFRQARVERFIRTMMDNHIGDLTLDPLKLTANFRSQPELVHSFNSAFSKLFPSEIQMDRPEEAPYVAAHAIREHQTMAASSTVWHPQVVTSGLSTDERRIYRRRLARSEAQTVRSIIEQWRARPLPNGRTEPWKIAVLVRNRSHLTHIVSALKQDTGSGPLPFRAIDIEPLGERPEVLDLYALTRALLHPADRVAWLSLLRAPWCGLELAQLHLLCGADDAAWSESTVPQLIIERGHELNEGSIMLLQRIWPVLVSALRQRSRIPLSELVERTWRSLGGDTYLVSEEKDNARQYFALLDELEQQNAVIDLALLKQRLNRLYAAASSSREAVDLLTIHGSKGLEWDVVLLPGIEKTNRSNRGRLLIWDEFNSPDEQGSQIILAPIVGKGRDSEALNEWLKRIHRRREAAECKRLFYVACTRAREELHLFAAPERRSDQSIQLKPGSLLEAAWPAAEEHFVDSNISSKPLIAPIFTLQEIPSDLILPSLAAEGEEYRRQTLLRLPLNLPLPSLPQITKQPQIDRGAPLIRFERPEGSFESRACGNVIHAFIELLAQRLLLGTSEEALHAEITTWQPRILTLLRNYGLSSATAARLAAQAQHALKATLEDEHGLWILGPRHMAASEYALMTADENHAGMRFDRIFYAGDAPLSEGDDFLWIVDFKTTPYTRSALDGFLERERDKYAPQMAAYASAMQNIRKGSGLRLGLYYPMLSKFIWWEHATK
ncbi:UvrD-helicase domain-containing protein [Edaphobacter flagellatus]|uniref:UvrD-helicase domain-containing protein n=1 Tax=Edaphobacter flagellatus TaxID=1933044 RepID=UPI0021B17A5C|nr:UvrD-helicase domain-containing protein [Edaphobacter flagellatus]